MFDTPKTFNAPGFDQPLREQTLAEFVMVLDENHLVRRELRELQRRSAQIGQISAELADAKLTISDMQVELGKLKSENSSMAHGIRLQGQKPNAPAPMPEVAPIYSTVGKASAMVAPGITIDKIPCRFCGKPIARGKSYWNIHLKKAHPQHSPIDFAQE